MELQINDATKAVMALLSVSHEDTMSFVPEPDLLHITNQVLCAAPEMEWEAILTSWLPGMIEDANAYDPDDPEDDLSFAILPDVLAQVQWDIMAQWLIVSIKMKQEIPDVWEQMNQRAAAGQHPLLEGEL